MKKKSNNNILSLIIAAYKQYCDFGYPKDPKIYVVRLNNKFLELLKKQVSTALFQGNIITDRAYIDGNRLYLTKDQWFNLEIIEIADKIIFGPQLISIPMVNL